MSGAAVYVLEFNEIWQYETCGPQKNEENKINNKISKILTWG